MLRPFRSWAEMPEVAPERVRVCDARAASVWVSSAADACIRATKSAGSPRSTNVCVYGAAASPIDVAAAMSCAVLALAGGSVSDANSGTEASFRFAISAIGRMWSKRSPVFRAFSFCVAPTMPRLPPS